MGSQRGLWTVAETSAAALAHIDEDARANRPPAFVVLVGVQDFAFVAEPAGQ